MEWGIIDDVSGARASVKMKGENTSRPPMKLPAGVSPIKGDNVVCEFVNGSWVIISIYKGD